MSGRGRLSQKVTVLSRAGWELVSHQLTADINLAGTRSKRMATSFVVDMIQLEPIFETASGHLTLLNCEHSCTVS